MDHLSNEANKPGRPHTPNRQGLYARAAKHAREAIDTLVELLHSKNPNIRLGAANSLLDKCLPDLRAIDINPIPEPTKYTIEIVEDSEAAERRKELLKQGANVMTVNAGNGFIPPNLQGTVGTS